MIFMDTRYPYQLPALPYAYEALVPILGGDTLRFHHDKHFQTYVDNLNKALADCADCQSKTLEELLASLDDLPEDRRAPVCNNAGGVYNHALYFECLSPNGGGAPSGELAQAMERAFGPYESFKKGMKEAALAVFGSGYAFLVTDRKGTVAIMQTANQNCPISEGYWPLLCVDVWEHAYYLDYQNRRAEYLDKWFDAIDWSKVAERYKNRR